MSLSLFPPYAGWIDCLFWTSLAIILYTYFGYPLLLGLLQKFFFHPVRKNSGHPSVSLIIAASNEENIIGEKLENSLGLMYPSERLEILVVSDGSTDRTVEIVSDFGSQGVNVLSLPRVGKLPALNRAVAETTGEILAFTDANSMLEPGSLESLVSSFGDKAVGGVCGNQKHLRNVTSSLAGRGENFYWKYDKWIKELESQIGSIVAADGSLYAIRRELFSPIMDGAQADDFAISSSVILKGHRFVFEPEAVSYEKLPVSSTLEFRRKIRVTNHCCRAIWNIRQALNPLRFGFYSLSLWSHKVGRYVVPFLLCLALVLNAVIVDSWIMYRFTLALQLLFYSLALAGLALRHRLSVGDGALSGPYYFCLANLAAILGVVSVLRGEQIISWQSDRLTPTRSKS